MKTTLIRHSCNALSCYYYFFSITLDWTSIITFHHNLFSYLCSFYDSYPSAIDTIIASYLITICLAWKRINGRLLMFVAKAAVSLCRFHKFPMRVKCKPIEFLLTRVLQHLVSFVYILIRRRKVKIAVWGVLGLEFY